MLIYCCCCETDVDARLTDGTEIYPHLPNLHALPFWKCDKCRNYVGCHHKTSNRTAPLGCIPTPQLKAARNHIHNILDPIWRDGLMKRKKLYAQIEQRLGNRRTFHTAHIRTIDEARQAYMIVRQIGIELRGNHATSN
jgi:hypothetical protein